MGFSNNIGTALLWCFSRFPFLHMGMEGREVTHRP